ncbi:Uncharacterized membrane protein [Halorientalis persicus]|uniref:Uncharacterized membrane protein n=1 Tax=Halorientalis persicus TaxID=1367881 RepID=A0A1H8VQ48_9EURY|nr:DUF1616 domain-containing protein [Halorientalis persicus]SEP17048.1 Uncharacterized membrane protein [Halorientalis persicus]
MTLDRNHAHGSTCSRRTAVLVAAGYTVAAAAVLAVGDGLPPLVRVPLALPIFLLTPGYAALAALFPRERPADEGGSAPGSVLSRRGRAGLGTAARSVLAVAVSVSLVGGVALGVTVSVGLTTVGVLVGVAALTVAAAAVALVRTPIGATVTQRRTTGDADRESPDPPTGPYTVVTLIAVAVAVLLLVGSGVIATEGGDTDPRSEFYLVGENGTDPVAAGYPTDLTVEGGQTYNLRIRQQGSRAREYTIVALLSPPDDRIDAEPTELARRAVVVQPNATAAPTVTVTPRRAGRNRTLAVLLYRGDAPGNPSRASAYRRLAIQVDVAPGAERPESPPDDPATAGEDDA